MPVNLGGRVINLNMPRFSIPPRYMSTVTRYPLFSALMILLTIWLLAFMDTSGRITTIYSTHRADVQRQVQAEKDRIDGINADLDRRNRIMEQKQNALFVLESDLIQREKALIPLLTKPTRKPNQLKQRNLVMYAYFETPSARRNLEFFISHGLWDDGLTDFIFVFNGETDAPDLLPNNPHSMYWDERFRNGGGPKITSIKRGNTCYDLGAHSEILLSEVDLDEGEEGIPGQWDMREKIEKLEKEYDEKMKKEKEETARLAKEASDRAERAKQASGKVKREAIVERDSLVETKEEYVNRNLRRVDGKRTGELWEKYSRFILMNASVRGPFIPFWSNMCWPEAFWSKLNERVKMVGMSYNCHKGQGHVQSMVWALDRAGLAAILQGPPHGLGHWCPTTMVEAITGEIHATVAIRNAGFEVDVLTAVWHSRDVIDVDKDGKGDGTKGYWKNCDDEDFFHEGAYYGFNVHPYETIFMKTARKMEENLIGNLTEWHDGSGYSSYAACAVPPP